VSKLAQELWSAHEGGGPAWKRLSQGSKGRTAERLELLRKEKQDEETKECTFRWAWLAAGRRAWLAAGQWAGVARRGQWPAVSVPAVQAADLPAAAAAAVCPAGPASTGTATG
jgi:hypothetical protein